MNFENYLRMNAENIAAMAANNNNNVAGLSTQLFVDQNDAIDSNSNAKKRKFITSIVSVVNVTNNSYRIGQNVCKRQKIDIVRVDDINENTKKLHLQINDLKMALAAEKNFVRKLK